VVSLTLLPLYLLEICPTLDKALNVIAATGISERNFLGKHPL
jgi:hypothetical protein